MSVLLHPDLSLHTQNNQSHGLGKCLAKAEQQKPARREVWRNGAQQGKEGGWQPCYRVLLTKIMVKGGIQVKNGFVGDRRSLLPRRGAEGTREILVWEQVKRTDIVG